MASNLAICARSTLRGACSISSPSWRELTPWWGLQASHATSGFQGSWTKESGSGRQSTSPSAGDMSM